MLLWVASGVFILCWITIFLFHSKINLNPLKGANAMPTLKCSRCGHEDEAKNFKDGYSDTTCCCLACIMILPAIFYYFFRKNKKICPKCGNIF